MPPWWSVAPSIPSTAFIPCTRRCSMAPRAPRMGSGHSFGHSSHGPCPLYRATLKTWQRGTQRWGQPTLKEAPGLGTRAGHHNREPHGAGHCLRHPPGDPRQGARASVVATRQPGLRRAGNKGQRQPPTTWVERLHSGTHCIPEATESKGEMEECLEDRKASLGTALNATVQYVGVSRQPNPRNDNASVIT